MALNSTGRCCHGLYVIQNRYDDNQCIILQIILLNKIEKDAVYSAFFILEK